MLKSLILLFSFTVLGFASLAQTKVDFSYFKNSWIEGELDSNGNRKGSDYGWYAGYEIDVNSDSLLWLSSYDDSNTGFSQQVKYHFNSANDSLVWHIVKEVRHWDIGDTVLSDRVTACKVLKLGPTELALGFRFGEMGITLAFLPREKK